ncbi:MAG: nucleotidyltransferase domain-containing protein [Peptococcaceae bacterium]|nr:nucleotidyltransferase domain-containing protein [Peptococcaceae bacterium]
MRLSNTPLDFDFIIKQLQKAPEVLQPYKQEVVALFLFGSVHRHELTPLSDIDLAVLYHSHLDKHRMLAIHTQLYGDLSQLIQTDDFDLVNLNIAPLTIQFSVIEDKTILVLHHPQALVNFQARVMSAYQDFYPILQEYYQSRLKLLE